MHTNNIEILGFFISLGNLKVPNKDQVAGLTKDLRARSKVPGMRKLFPSTTGLILLLAYFPLIMLLYEAANNCILQHEF